MHRSLLFRLGVLALAMAWAGATVAQAAVEATDANGRRVLLMDDGTWRPLEPPSAEGTPASSQEADTRMADLRLLRRTDTSGGCRFDFELVNGLPYEIRSLVPYFAVQRAGGVVYATESVAFAAVKPGASMQRRLSVAGIACGDIERLKVHGGDRCEMGELHRFSDAKGVCLARLRIEPSSLVTIEK